MAQFKPGDRVRCVQLPSICHSNGLTIGETYTFLRHALLDCDWLVIEELRDGRCFPNSCFVLAEQNTSGVGAERETVYIPTDQCPDERLIVTVTGVTWAPVWPKDNCVPATAKAILDLDRKPPTEKQQLQASGVARAVKNITHNSAIIGSYRRSDF